MKCDIHKSSTVICTMTLILQISMAKNIMHCKNYSLRSPALKLSKGFCKVCAHIQSWISLGLNLND